MKIKLLTTAQSAVCFINCLLFKTESSTKAIENGIKDNPAMAASRIIS